VHTSRATEAEFDSISEENAPTEEDRGKTNAERAEYLRIQMGAEAFKRQMRELKG
jgi:hypothetical protein